MDDELFCRPSILKSLKNNNNIKAKRLLGDGKFLLDIFPDQEAVCKIATVWNEGEFAIWPSLRHESIIALLDIIIIDEEVTIFIFPYLKVRLGSLILEANFMHHPKCFDRKKSYIRDVLCGLEYLHQLSVSLLNLSDKNILISSESDKAIISDLSCSVLDEMTDISGFPIDKVQFLPPELKQFQDNELFYCMPIDMWAFGVLTVQIFTMHIIPNIVDEKEVLAGLTTKILLVANPGSYLTEVAAHDLKEFVEPFLEEDPMKRMDAKTATGLSFLRNSVERLDKQAWDFWKGKDAAALLSKMNRSNQQKTPQKSIVSTVGEQRHEMMEEKANSLKKYSYNTTSQKTEQHIEKSVPNFEDDIQKLNPFSSECLQKFDSIQENDLWAENKDLQILTSKKNISKYLPKLGISSLSCKACKDLRNTSHTTIPKYLYVFDGNDHQKTSLLPKPLTFNHISEQYPYEIKENTVENLKTHENPLSSGTPVVKSGRFSNDSSINEVENCFDEKYVFPRLARRNAFRFKKGSKLDYKFKCKPAPQQSIAESTLNVPIHDQVEERTMAHLLDGMFSYDFQCTSFENKSENVDEVINSSFQIVASKKINPTNYNVDVPLDLPLCSSSVDMVNKKAIKKKPVNRFLKLLCPGSKHKIISTTTLHLDSSD